ncbi:MAG: SusC/RagA family TonB-linked outer membrane protein [Candidatus Cryptobacteroides sp.]
MNQNKFAAFLLSLTLFIGGGYELLAQNQIKGTVKDQNGAPVIGAGILVLEDATKGAIVDADGNWSMVLQEGNTLQISAIGYKTAEVKVGTSQVINVVLEDDVNLLDDVVVIGYGTARKGDLTGAIGSVNGDKISERSTTMLSTALQGQVAGLQVTRSNGGPGSSATLRVRGVTTMSTNDPLVIVDGVPGSINDILASDVESITVLKDAASAAIYGSRAAAGVVLVTTKRAQEGKFNIDYSYSYAIDKPTARPENGDVIDYMNVQNELKYNDGAAEYYSQYSKETIDTWMQKNAEDPYHYPNEDWVNILLKKTTSHQDHTLSVSGGTERLRTKVTLNMQDADGYYDNKSYKRIAGRVNNDFKINKWLHANFDFDFSKSDAKSPNLGNTIYWAYLIAPIYNCYWEDGRYADGKTGTNARAMLDEGGVNLNRYYKFGGKAQIDITPVKGLTITGIVAPRFTFTYGKQFKKAVQTYGESGNVVYAQGFTETNLYENRNNTNNITYQAYANYQNKFGSHSINVMAGYEGYTYKWENLGASREKYGLTSYPYLNIGPKDYQYNSGSAGHNAYQSVFGRVMYSFKDRYMIQANVRGDGSSRFAKNCRWGVFPSVSAGWSVSEEPWFNVRGFDYLKIRASIGQLGNERISSSEFPYQATMSFGNSYLVNDKGEVSAFQNAAQVYYAFPDITWETTTTYGAGIDANFLDGRLRISGDIYHKKTKNMLLTLGFPSYAGYSAPTQNAGDMYTNGWEIELGWNDTVGDFSYGVSFNLSDYRSKMGYLGDKKTVNGNYLLEKGSYYNEWYMYQSDGLFYTDADLYDAEGNKVPVLTANDKAGSIKYVDQNGDGIINADDKVRLGNSLPEYLFGGNINLGWKGLDFSLSFSGVGHQRVLFQSYWIQPLKEQWGAVPKLVVGNCWSSQNTEAQNRKAKYPKLTYQNTANTYAGSDYWLFNGAYFRIKNITLGYTIPSEIIQKTKVFSNLRVYFSATDLPAFSKYPKGWDPEVSGNSADFISTSFIFGVNVKF